MNNITSTEAIVLKTTNYSDTSLIVKVFSEDYGVQTYLAKGVKGRKAKNKVNFFQPLSILKITGVQTKSELLILKEVSFAHPFQEIPFDVLKSSVIFFINEFLYRIFLADDFSDKALYSFIKKGILLLDQTQNPITNFHVVFLAHFTYFMGIFPNDSENGRFFDITGGTFTHHSVIPNLDEKSSTILKDILRQTFENFHQIEIPKHDRKQLLEGLLLYYKTHIDGFKEIKSYEVLKTILND